jgi:hypothetical protein
LILLTVEVGLQGEFGAAHKTLEASLMEESEVFQRTDLVDLIHDQGASQANVLVRGVLMQNGRLIRSGMRSAGAAAIGTSRLLHQTLRRVGSGGEHGRNRSLPVRPAKPDKRTRNTCGCDAMTVDSCTDLIRNLIVMHHSIDRESGGSLVFVIQVV